MKEFKGALFTTVIIFLSFFLYTKFAGPIPFFVQSVQTTKTTLFTVSGTGQETAIPDTASFNIGVTKTAQNVTDAQNQVNSAINNILNDLKKLGIDNKNIKTTDYSINPNYDYSYGKQTPNGYTATQELQIKVTPIDKASKAIDVSTLDGANITGGISFTFNDSTQKNLENKARIDAINNAKEKAQSLANASGIKLGKIVDVEETPNEIQPLPYLNTQMKTSTAIQAPTTVTPGQNTISTTISLSYETY